MNPPTGPASAANHRGLRKKLATLRRWRGTQSANALLPPPPTSAKVPDLPPLDEPLFEKAAVPPAPAVAATSVLSQLVKNKITNRNAYTSYAQFVRSRSPGKA